MEYTSHDSVPYFSDCLSVVKDVGFTLVELQVVPQSGIFHVSAVIAASDPAKNIGVSDCSKVHHVLGAKILALLQKEKPGLTEDDISMEVSSPGTERNIKNAAEFESFLGREIWVWDKNVSDWVRGKIKSANAEEVVLEDETGACKTVKYGDIAKAKFIHN